MIYYLKINNISIKFTKDLYLLEKSNIIRKDRRMIQLFILKPKIFLKVVNDLVNSEKNQWRLALSYYNCL